jgi:signal transduction histidine kinase/DNA-binding response OmpR family regulator
VDIGILERKLVRVTRAKKAAETLLEEKAAELFAANQKLEQHAKSLAVEANSAKSEAQTWKGRAHQASSELEDANIAVFKAERRLWDALEAIKDGFALFDAQDCLVAANQAYVHPFGKDAHKLKPGIHYSEIARLISEGSVIKKTEGNRDDWVAGYIDERENQSAGDRIVQLSDNLWIKMVDLKTRDNDTVSLRLDVTSSKQRECELKEARENAEAASRAKSAFLANMSHEIRTPMNGVVGMADLLGETELNTEQNLFATTIKNSAEALLTIINDVLDYSKIEASKLKLLPEPFDLERTILDVIMLLTAKAREKNLDLVVDFDMFLPTRFVADPGRIRQIMVNLLGNSIKFTESGHVLVRVVGIEESPGQQKLHIAVEDTGIGIPPEKLEHVFGEFSQVEDAKNRKFEGTGLGLAITRQLIQLMGGRMWVDSVLGEGSCFGFGVTLPIDQSEAAIPARLPTSGKRIVIVDDLQVNRLILEKQLQGLGFSVTAFGSAKEAAEFVMAPGATVDLVVTDHEMPEMDGIEFARKISTSDDCPPIILFSSAHGQECLKEDMDLFKMRLVKPVTHRDLAALLSDKAPTLNVSQKSHPQTNALLSPSQPNGKKLEVLLAEDNRTNRLVFTKMVKKFNLSLEIAEDGQQAIDLFRQIRPDIIVMDVSMPNVDGLEATRQIRQIEMDENLTRTPIIALTAHAMDGDDKPIFEAGMDHYMTKPLKKATIESKLNEIAFSLADQPLTSPSQK